MTTIAYENTDVGVTNAYVVTWPNLQNGDVGGAVRAAQYTDKSAQLVGVFGTGGAVVIEGSNNGIDWATLTDPQGNPLNMSAAGIELVSEATVFVRPRAVGDGTTDLTVHLFLKE